MGKRRSEIESRIRDYKNHEHCRDYHCSDQKRPRGGGAEQGIAKATLKLRHGLKSPTVNALCGELAEPTASQNLKAIEQREECQQH
jgi:hypothetical protein